MQQFLDLDNPITQTVIGLLLVAFVGWVVALRTPVWRSIRIWLERRKFRAVPTLRRVNQLAAESYRRRVSRERTGKGRRAKTLGKWENRDWLGQVHFVEPVVAPDDAMDGQEPQVAAGGHQPQSSSPVVGEVRKMLQRAYTNSRSGEDASCRVSIQGPPGAGKTTVLVRLYFELLGVANSEAPATTRSDGTRTVPMLIEPRKLEADLASAVDECVGQKGRTGCGWFEALVRAWLQANGVRPISEETLHHLARDLKQSLVEGRIILLLDGYDELSQMGLSKRLNELFESPFVVYADRSGTRRTSSGVAPLVLDEQWPPVTCRSYLEKAWSSIELARWANPVLARIGWPESAWLRNPRHFVALVGVLKKAHIDKGRLTEQFLEDVIRGQYQIIAAVFLLAFERLKRLPGVSSEEDVKKKLGVIAAEQSSKGELHLSHAEFQSEPVWRSVESMTEIVTGTSVADGIELTIKPFFYHYFCAQQIVSNLAALRLPSIQDRWSAMTLAAASAELRLHHDLQPINFLWESLARKTNEQEASRLLKASRLLTLNLLNLGTRTTDTAVIQNRFLENLDLGGANLRDLRFEGCTFNGSSLKGAALQGATFVRCRFVGTDLSEADASGASFRDCVFLNQSRPSALEVEHMQIAAATFDGSDVTEGDLLAAKAQSLHSRYRGSFGPWFANEQAWILGGDFESLDSDYVELKRQEVLRLPLENPVYMIDLMAGGAVDGLRALHAEFHNLHILALDRDIDQLEKLALPPKRFTTWKVDLQDGVDGSVASMPGESRNHGSGVDLRGGMRSVPGWRDGAHLIVGKKAIHEVPRVVQQRLIAQCRAALRDEGRLVLFTDSPGRLYEDQRERLDEIRGLLQRREQPRKEVIEDQTFGATPQDVGLFCNLWVMLKDWANDNEHEVSNRYFSGRAEIEEWCTDEKFSLIEQIPSYAPSDTRVGYRITPPKFNEDGIRFALDYLGSNSRAPNVDKQTIFQKIYGSDQDRFRLLIDFTRHHLLPDPWGPPTELGRKLNARPEKVDFERIDYSLGRWVESHQDHVEDVTFDFPVHILVFEKRPVRGKHRGVAGRRAKSLADDPSASARSR